MSFPRSSEVTFAQNGEALLFEDFKNEGPMWTGDGDREARVSVKFHSRYTNKPLIHLSIVLLDARTDVMVRYDLTHDNITNKGFDIVFKTWGDSKFARAKVAWLALGPMIRDEYWVDF